MVKKKLYLIKQEITTRCKDQTYLWGVVGAGWCRGQGWCRGAGWFRGAGWDAGAGWGAGVDWSAGADWDRSGGWSLPQICIINKPNL